MPRPARGSDPLTPGHTCPAPSSAMPSTARPAGACSSGKSSHRCTSTRRAPANCSSVTGTGSGPSRRRRPRVRRDSVRLLSPVTTDQQFICQGVNYRSHVQESGLRVEDFPFNTIFTKAPSCITAADAPVARPPQVELLDYEIELGLVLRRDVPAGDAGRRPAISHSGWPASRSSTTCRRATSSCRRGSSTRARASAASVRWGRDCCC